VQLIFDRVATKKTPGSFARVIQVWVNPSLHIQYKNFDLKQYFNGGARLPDGRNFPQSQGF
jgi:hypothetical protein